MNERLIALARESLRAHLSGGAPRGAPLPGEGALPRGCFVSLKKQGALRGCMGTMEPACRTLEEEVMANALAAGLRDPRFDPVRLEELAELTISIDLLSPMEEVPSESYLDPAVYGVLVRAQGKSGVLLPDLPGIATTHRQIAVCREKAGIADQEQVTLHRFTVERLES